MPSRRVATVLLSAAVVAGATAGVGAARANFDPLGLLQTSPPAAAAPPEESPSSAPAPSRSPEPSLTPTPTPTPTPTRTQSPSPRPSRTRTPPPEPTPTEQPEPPEPPEPKAPTEYVNATIGNTTISVDVPEGWRAVELAAVWRDFHDPTDNLNLRIRVEDFAESNQAAVEEQYNIRKELRGFTSYGITPFTWMGQGADGEEVEETGYAFRYSYTDKRGDKDATRYAVERYIHTGRLMVGAYGWYGQLELVEPAAQRAMDTFHTG
jgi:hypothetical protein